MRQLQRPNVSLPTLIRIANTYKNKLNKLPSKGGPPEDRWRHPDVRGALYAMQGDVCAYCQRELSDSDPGDVEHFRPKSKYRWLMYAFSNLFLSCRKCNQRLKGAEFPLIPGARRTPYWKRRFLANEKRLLIDPALDPVEDWIQVDFQDDLWLFKCKDAFPPDHIATLRVEETMRFFMLNQNTRLVRRRSERVDQALRILKDIKGGDHRRREELQEMASRYRPHGIAVRHILAEHMPALLPRPKDELLWLVTDFLVLLKDNLRKRSETDIQRRILEKEKAELCWSLAVL